MSATRCSPDNRYATCPFRMTGRLGACREPGGCIHPDYLAFLRRKK